MAEQKLAQVMLIAPVGTREVTLTDLNLLPDEAIRARWNHADPKERIGARIKGEVLSADFERYAPAVSLDILGKAVKYVLQQHGKIDQLILVASDQVDAKLPYYRNNDTIEIAKLMRTWLRADKTLKPVGDHTKIEVVTENPADYEIMRNFYRKKLPGWRKQLAPDGVCYLEITGGTSQMSTMLLFEGVNFLRTQATPLYVLAEYEMPLHLDIGRQILVDELITTVQRDLEIHAYHAAWKTLLDNRTLSEQALPYFAGLVAVIDAARHRLNFDFAKAQKALFGADQTVPPSFKRAILDLADELSEAKRSKEWLIAEVFYGAQVSFQNEVYADFVGRTFRFQEALLRYLCETWGAQFDPKDKARLDQSWVTEANLLEALQKQQVDVQREISRRSLHILAMEIARRANNSEGQTLLKRLGRFEQIAALRNQLVITHGFEGVSLQKLADAYKGDAHGILEDMKLILQEALGIEPKVSPYTRINQLCQRLLEKTNL